jgi:glycosyltransferase involved in cell wall biosynthesis
MKVVIGVHHFPPHHIGGGENEAYRVAKGLLDRGHEVNVICVEDIQTGSAPGLFFIDDLYKGVPVRRLFYNHHLIPDKTRFEYDNPWIGDHLKMFLAEQVPDIYFQISGYLLTGSTLRAAAELGLPVVVELTEFWFLCPRINMLKSDGRLSSLPFNPVDCARCLGEEKRRFRIPGKLVPGVMEQYWRQQKVPINQIEQRSISLNNTLAGVDQFISPSRFLREMYIESGLPEDKIIFIRQGVELAGNRTQSLVTQKSDKLRIGYLGQIAPHKGTLLLAQAIKSISDPRLKASFYGDTLTNPGYVNEIRQLIANDSRMELAGTYHSPAELEKILLNLDVLVMTSVWYENSPTVILEAYSCNTPVIAAKLGGMAELVQDGQNGFLFEPGNAADLAVKIKRLLDQKELLQEFQGNIAPVKTVKQQIDEFENLFISIAMKKTVEAQA